MNVHRILGLQAELEQARQAIANATTLEQYDRAHRLVAFLKDALAKYGVNNL